MNFENDETLNIPLFDNILSQNTALMTPRKSPSKQKISTKVFGEQCTTPLESSFNTPQKQESGSRITTPRTMLKSFANQNGNLEKQPISPASSPVKILSMYNKLMKETEAGDSSSNSYTSAAKQHSPLKSSPLKPVDPFWQERQKMLSRTPKKKSSPKKKSFQSMMASISKKSATNSCDELSNTLLTPQKQQVEKRKLTLDDNDDDEVFTRVPSFNLLNPKINFNQKSHNEDRSPSKRQKSPQKSGSSVIQKLIFEDEEYDTTDDGGFAYERSLSLSEHETVFENSNLNSVASSIGPYQKPIQKQSEKYISEEEIDNILFKHHLAMKTEFSVGLGEHKFDKEINTPYLNGREDEYNDILKFLEDKLEATSDSKDALMIVGPPGTGKSRQVWQILESHYSYENKSFTLSKNSGVEINNVFSFIINCMGYSDLNGIIMDLNSQFGEGYNFYDTDTFERFLLQTKIKIILVMDEFDKFVHNKENGLYDFIGLAKKYSHFILVSITNSFDIGNISEEFSLEQLIFKPYESKEIEKIVTAKSNLLKSSLISLVKSEFKDLDVNFLNNYNLFQRNALLTMSKKFGNQNGDLRDVTNFIYQLLELRESKALADRNGLTDTDADQEKFKLIKKTEYSMVTEKENIVDIISKHWTMKEIVFQDVNEVFNLSSDMFNLQKLLNKMNIWQQFVLVMICKVYDSDLLEHQKNIKINKDKYEYKGIDVNDVFDKYKQQTLALKNKIKSINNSNQLRNGMNSVGSHNVLLEKEVNQSDFIKIIEFLEVSGLLNKYTFRKARTIKNYVLVSYNTQDVYELLSHSALFKNII